MTNLPRRLLLIGTLIGFDLVVGHYFLRTQAWSLPPTLVQLAQQVGITIPTFPNPAQPATPHLDAVEIEVEVQTIRQQHQVVTLDRVVALDLIAAGLIDQFRADQLQVDSTDYSPILEQLATDQDYDYQNIFNIGVIGPLSSQHAVQALSSDPGQLETLLSTDISEFGIATGFEQLNGINQGITVIVFAQPALPPSDPAVTKKQVTQQTQVIPDISDQEVFAALNSYRAVHHVPQLVTNQHLCDYAQKRVGDLVAFGGLDAHQGFEHDFSDANNFPEPIKQYPGGAVGENLAHQFCRNGTTGESFVAQTGTSLIEWCFDSSQTGHREAQLNPRYTAACVRHASHMYVIIFGE